MPPPLNKLSSTPRGGSQTENFGTSSMPKQESAAEFSLCEHSTTSNVKVISEIVLNQVKNLRVTDKGWQENLEVAGGSLDKVQFVRNTNYLNKMSEIV